MSRKNTRHINPLQQLPRFVRAAVYNRLTIRHYRFFKERIIWHGPRYKILMNGSADNMVRTLKWNHRNDNKHLGLHRNRRKLKRFVERARWAQEHPQDPIDVFFKTLREKFDPEVFKQQILNFPYPKPSGIAEGQLTYDDSSAMKLKQKMAIHVPASIDPHKSLYDWVPPGYVFPDKIQDRILIKPDSPVYDALKMDMRHFFEPIKSPAIELSHFALLEKERIQIANPEKTFIIMPSDVAPTEEK